MEHECSRVRRRRVARAWCIAGVGGHAGWFGGGAAFHAAGGGELLVKGVAGIGGADIWPKNHVGMRVEFRDHVRRDVRGTVHYFSIRGSIALK